jgi:hypothetical protein
MLLLIANPKSLEFFALFFFIFLLGVFHDRYLVDLLSLLCALYRFRLASMFHESCLVNLLLFRCAFYRFFLL